MRFTQRSNILGALNQVTLHRFDLTLVCDKCLKRAGHGAHAATHTRRQQLHQYIKQLLGIIQAFLRLPIRRIHLLFDARIMKATIREPVNRKDVAILL